MHLSRSGLYPEIPTFMGEKTIILRKFNFVHTKSLCLLVLTDIMNMGGPKYQLLFGGQIQFSDKPTIILYQVTWLICTIHIIYNIYIYIIFGVYIYISPPYFPMISFSVLVQTVQTPLDQLQQIYATLMIISSWSYIPHKIPMIFSFSGW